VTEQVLQSNKVNAVAREPEAKVSRNMCHVSLGSPARLAAAAKACFTSVQTPEQKVAGSNPARRTMIPKDLAAASELEKVQTRTSCIRYGTSTDFEAATLLSALMACFHRAYIADLLKDHREVVAAFKREANAGQNPDIKEFASKTLPTLEEHLRLAERPQSAAAAVSPQPGRRGRLALWSATMCVILGARPGRGFERARHGRSESRPCQSVGESIVGYCL
jgi:predicted outer membrane protein